MIVCVSPSSQHYDETHNTLKYANRAKNIKTKVSRNMINVNRHVSQYVKAIYELTQEVEELKRKLGDSTKEAMDKLKKQEVQRNQQIQEGSKRLKLAYENSQAIQESRIQDYKNLRLIERRIAMITAWTSAFDTVFSARQSDAPPKVLLTVRAEAEKVLQELENNRFGLQHRLQGPTAEREIDRALDATLRNLQAIDGVTDADHAAVNAEATLYRTIIERDFYQNLAEINADVSTSISVLSKAHFETVASLSELNLQDDSASDAVRQTLEALMKICTDATSQIIKPNGELIKSQENYTIPRVNFDTPRKKVPANSVFMNLASPLRGPFAQGGSGGNTSQIARPSPRAFKVGTPNAKAVLFAKKPPKKMKRVRWQDETEAEGLKLDILEENKRYRAEQVHHLSTSNSASEAADTSFADISAAPRHSSSSARNRSESSHHSSQHERHNYTMEPTPARRNNKMEMGFLSKSKRENSPPPPPRPSSSSSNHGSSRTTATSTSNHHPRSTNNAIPRPHRPDFPLSETDTSILNHKTRPSTIFEDSEDNTIELSRVWKSASASNKSAIMTAAKRRVSSGSLSGPSARARRSRPNHGDPESNTSVIFKAGHARRMSTAPEKENVGGARGHHGHGLHGHSEGGRHGHGVLSPKGSGGGFKSSGARRITISGRGEIGGGLGRRTSLAPSLVKEVVKLQQVQGQGQQGQGQGQNGGAGRTMPWR